MNDEKKQILPQDLMAGETIKKMVLVKHPSTLFVFPGMAVRPEEYQRATLAIALSDSDHVAIQAMEKELPEDTPILFLGAEDRLPIACVSNTSARIIDYLRIPVSKEIFFHRISLLTQVQRISSTSSQKSNQHYSRDALTGLYTRRYLTSRLSEIFASARETEKELSMLILNIDHFSYVNNSLGLEFGDYILDQLSSRLTQAVRDIDTCYRFSNEEIIVILPEASLQYAKETAQKIKNACSGRPFNDGVNTVTLTISIGIASLQAHQPDNPDKFIFMVEKALFEAKAEGCNHICVYTHQDIKNDLPQLSPLAFFKEKLGHILNNTKSSAISSLETLTKNVAGPEHKTQTTSVSHYILLLGSHIGLAEKHVQTFHNSITLYNCFRALLHNDLLAKPDKLTEEERYIIEDFPYKLADISEMFDYLADEKSLLLSFNERYDGTGYPDGLKGDEIPLGARLFHIVDAVAAMNADRPFRKKLSPKKILMELKQGAGRQFDPFLILQLLTVIEQNRLLDIEPEVLIQTRQDIMNSFTQHRP
jgi:diguanylate cyclase (GGDEF)-like protein